MPIYNSVQDNMRTAMLLEIKAGIAMETAKRELIEYALEHREYDMLEINSKLLSALRKEARQEAQL